jgi:hypothetical protein
MTTTLVRLDSVESVVKLFEGHLVFGTGDPSVGLWLVRRLLRVPGGGAVMRLLRNAVWALTSGTARAGALSTSNTSNFGVRMMR